MQPPAANSVPLPYIKGANEDTPHRAEWCHAPAMCGTAPVPDAGTLPLHSEGASQSTGSRERSADMQHHAPLSAAEWSSCPLWAWRTQIKCFITCKLCLKNIESSSNYKYILCCFVWNCNPSPILINLVCVSMTDIALIAFKVSCSNRRITVRDKQQLLLFV